MALTEGGSFLVSSLLSLLLFSGMQVHQYLVPGAPLPQVYRSLLASSQLLTIVTGGLGSLLALLLITAGYLSSQARVTSAAPQSVT